MSKRAGKISIHNFRGYSAMKTHMASMLNNIRLEARMTAYIVSLRRKVGNQGMKGGL